MKQTRELIVLTVNGKAEVVVQDTKSYQQLLDKIERLEAIADTEKELSNIESNDASEWYSEVTGWHKRGGDYSYHSEFSSFMSKVSRCC